MSIVGTLYRMHLKPLKIGVQAALADPLIAIAGGGGVNLFDLEGNAWIVDDPKDHRELDGDPSAVHRTGSRCEDRL